MHQIKLEQYYNGDEHWANFLKFFPEIDLDLEISRTLLAQMQHNHDFAKVIFYQQQASSINWINSKIPALDQLTPKACLTSATLKNRLRECLMRFPI